VGRHFSGSDVRAVERVADASEADERVVGHLARLGCDPSLPRETHHFLYFGGSAAAESVATVLRADGWTTDVERSEGAWLLVARHVAAVTSRTVRETRSRLEALAAEHGGFYDGWEAPI
jgi:Regulator of ribonuclease activity B